MIYLMLFLTFFKIGAFTFGGGYAMLPLIQEEVLANQWMDMDSLINFVAVSESTPGPFAINISTYVGVETAGIPGAILATLGVTLPSFLVILIVARCYIKFKNSKIVNGCMLGLRPAVIGLIGAAVISVGKTVVENAYQQVPVLGIAPIVVTAVIFLIVLELQYKKLHPIFIIGLSALFGILAGMAGWF